MTAATADRLTIASDVTAASLPRPAGEGVVRRRTPLLSCAARRVDGRLEHHAPIRRSLPTTTAPSTTPPHCTVRSHSSDGCLRPPENRCPRGGLPRRLSAGRRRRRFRPSVSKDQPNLPFCHRAPNGIRLHVADTTWRYLSFGRVVAGRDAEPEIPQSRTSFQKTEDVAERAEGKVDAPAQH